ncbi:MAG: sterol desaturase family protein, partial [Pseudomonadota bacterium]
MSPKDTDPGMSREWHYHPDLPIQITPVFDWPPRPVAALAWLANMFLSLAFGVGLIGLATLIYVVAHPDPATMTVLSLDWAWQIWARNIVLMLVVAGGLHIWLYHLRGQGKRLKYDHREPGKSGQFTFGNQVLDNMFWSLASGVTLWSAAEVVLYWAQANGWAPGVTFEGNPIWFVAWFVLIPLWSSMHFYWVHRLLHWPPLYKLAHALHHRNVNVGPWSGISMHPVEHLLFYTNFLIHFVVPSHPLHVLFHGYVQSTHPVFSHSGFEEIVVKDKKQLKAGVFFHQLHHRYFECNYGTVEMPWDRWF